LDKASDLVERVRAASSRFDESYWRSVDRESRFPDEYWDSISKSGAIGFIVSREHGGMGGSLTELARATQMTARYYAGIGSYLFLSGCLMAKTIETVGEERTRRTVLPELLSGKSMVSIALSEEESGLDALAIKTTARRRGDLYVINGSKNFVTNAERAERLVVFARVGEQGGRGLTMFLIDPRGASVRLTRLDKLGMKFVNLYRVDITGAEVPGDSVLGGVGEAWTKMRPIFTIDRILTAASLVGTGRLALDKASKYVSVRRVLGRIISSNQGVQFPLADAVTRLIGAEMMTAKAAATADRGGDFTSEANVALFEAQQATSIATDRAVQAFGGHGYLTDYDVDRYWRDARVHRVHPLSEEILLAMIAVKDLGLPKSY
jgi:acyl-CoA dehydrogenase